MNTTYQEKETLTLSLGNALKQTFEDVITLRKELESSHHKISLLEMVQETLTEENIVLRDRNEGFEESLIETKQRHSSALQEIKEHSKQENIRVAKVLRRTLQAFKRSKNSLDKLQTEYEKLQNLCLQKNNYISDLHFIIQDNQTEIQKLNSNYISLLKVLLTPNSPLAEQKITRLEESLKVLKEKAKVAILQKEDELKRHRTQNQELQLRLNESEQTTARLIKEEDQSKLRLAAASKKIDEDQAIRKKQIEQIEALKKQLDEVNEQNRLLKESQESLKIEVNDLQEKYLSSQARLGQKDAELSAMYTMKSEYERMHMLFSNIKACMGGQTPQMPEKQEVSVDLFELPKTKNPGMQQELF